MIHSGIVGLSPATLGKRNPINQPPMPTLSHINKLVLSLAITIALLSCSSQQTTSVTKATAPGALVEYTLIDTFGTDKINWTINEGLDLFMTNGTMKASDFRDSLAKPQQGVKLYKVTYSSIIPEKNDAVVTAYGLIAIPQNVQPNAPIVSYQHGTIFDRSWTPSNPAGSMETQLMIAQFASQGYIVIAADYFGTSKESTLPNSYFVAQSTAQACLDMYRASLQVLEKEHITPGKLFISGWSQGGYSTLAFLRYLELLNIPVAGVATASGPADPLLFISESLNNPSPFAASFAVAAVSNLMLSFDAYYSLNGYFEGSIQPKYINLARQLHRFELSYEDFAKQVPPQPDRVFLPEFYTDSRTALKPFWKALDAGAAYRWRMSAPLRCFYSLRDEAVPWQVARMAADYQRTLGHPNAEAIDAGPNADHRSVYLYSLVEVKRWFDGMK